MLAYWSVRQKLNRVRRPLKIRTESGHARVRKLGSIGIFSFFYYNFVKRGLFATKFCTYSATDNMNKCCKFG